MQRGAFIFQSQIALVFFGLLKDAEVYLFKSGGGVLWGGALVAFLSNIYTNPSALNHLCTFPLGAAVN